MNEHDMHMPWRNRDSSGFFFDRDGAPTTNKPKTNAEYEEIAQRVFKDTMEMRYRPKSPRKNHDPKNVAMRVPYDRVLLAFEGEFTRIE